jgi:hypothetical protein
MRYTDRVNRPREGLKMGFDFGHSDGVMSLKGTYIIELTDADTGKVLDHREQSNIVTLDGGVLVALLLASGSGLSRTASQQGLTMLAVGTGATGPLLNPDAPDPRQRKLNSELWRKELTVRQFRNATGGAVSYPTNVVDFTATFGAGEAEGPLNEMGLLRTITLGPTPGTPITPAPVFPAYDPTIDLTVADILANYTVFSIVTKPANSLLTITWRLTA